MVSQKLLPQNFGIGIIFTTRRFQFIGKVTAIISSSEQTWKTYYDPCPFSTISYLMLMMCNRPYNLASSTGNPALEIINQIPNYISTNSWMLVCPSADLFLSFVSAENNVGQRQATVANVCTNKLVCPRYLWSSGCPPIGIASKIGLSRVDWEQEGRQNTEYPRPIKGGNT